MPQLAVIIVTFGRLELTKQTLTSLFDCGIDAQTQVIVVDNGSPIELQQTLLTYSNKIDHLILLNKNYGKPYALNLGIAAAKEKCIAENKPAPDYFLFCDNDLLFHANWRDQLLQTYKEHESLPLGCLSACRWSSHRVVARTGATTTINIGMPYPAGCCILMSAHVLQINGLWDTRRKIRTVDTSYFRNAISRGFIHAAVHPTSLIEHTGIRQRSWNLATGDPYLLP